jgi:hypothetical protein
LIIKRALTIPTLLISSMPDKRTYILDPKEDILENVCAENEKDWSHLVKK